MEAARVQAAHRRLLDSLDRPEETQRELLTRILKHNAGTVFGHEHGLSGVRTVGELRRAVPIRTHEELMPWIERAMDGNVLTADDPAAYFSSSGSTGREKHIPVTRTYMRRFFLPFYHAAFAPLLGTLPGSATAPDGVLNLWQDPTAPAARTRKGQPHIGSSQVDYRRFGEDSAVGPGNDASWSRIPEALASADPWERAYFKLRLAAAQDIRAVIGINPAMVAALPYQLRTSWPRLVEDIRAGTLGGRPHTSPDPERADEIARYAATFGTVLPQHLWPRLTAVLVWNSALASLYLPRGTGDLQSARCPALRGARRVLRGTGRRAGGPASQRCAALPARLRVRVRPGRRPPVGRQRDPAADRTGGGSRLPPRAQPHRRALPVRRH
ncbi:hypothetical protein SVIOM342S_10362 [Streptomyces violaceorubidus]